MVTYFWDGTLIGRRVFTDSTDRAVKNINRKMAVCQQKQTKFGEPVEDITGLAGHLEATAVKHARPVKPSLSRGFSWICARALGLILGPGIAYYLSECPEDRPYIGRRS